MSYRYTKYNITKKIGKETDLPHGETGHECYKSLRRNRSLITSLSGITNIFLRREHAEETDFPSA